MTIAMPATDQDFDAWLEDTYPDQAEFMVAVNEMFALNNDVDMITQCIMQLDNELGISNEDDMRDRYFFEDDSHKPEEEFAEYYVMELCDGERIMNDAGMMPWLMGCIDYEAVWKSALQFDFNDFEFDGVTYFFLNH